MIPSPEGIRIDEHCNPTGLQQRQALDLAIWPTQRMRSIG